MGSIEPMIVSANSAICTPAEPMTAGTNALKNCFTSAVQPGRANQREKPGALRGDHHQRKFENARQQHAGGGGDARVGEDEPDRKARDDGDVQQHRRERGRREAPVRVHRSRDERDERHAQQVRERDARHEDRVRELFGIVGEAGRQQQRRAAA